MHALGIEVDECVGSGCNRCYARKDLGLLSWICLAFVLCLCRSVLLLRAELFALEIKVQEFVTTDSNGRKILRKATVMRWEMEIGSFSLDLLMSSLLKEVNWGSNQSATVWFYDKRMGEDVRLDNEIQMIDMFEMYKSEMSCAILVGIFDKALVENHIEHEFDDLTPLCVIPPDDPPVDVPTSTQPNPNTPHPEPDIGIQQPQPQPQPETVDASLPDPFDIEEEYVGVDDEHMYMPTPPAQPTQPTEPPQPAENEQNEGGVDNANAEPEVNDADPEELHVLHDPTNPNIVKGALFSDIVAFRKAVRHYAIVKGFEFTDLKTDPTRFIAKCAHEGCPWRIHASRVQGQRAIEVQMFLVCCPY